MKKFLFFLLCLIGFGSAFAVPRVTLSENKVLNQPILAIAELKAEAYVLAIPIELIEPNLNNGNFLDNAEIMRAPLVTGKTPTKLEAILKHSTKKNGLGVPSLS